ncbi:hypothetical protein [Thermosipho ferrireducens]|nr:hypothetical protein [Thermosipho ferrireducens]
MAIPVSGRISFLGGNRGYYTREQIEHIRFNRMYQHARAYA